MSEEGFGNHLVSEYWQAISPLHNIEKGHPPAILFVGTDDHILSVATANKYRDKLTSVGSKAETIIYPEKKHIFFNRSRSAEAFIDILLRSHQFLYQAKFIAHPPVHISDNPLTKSKY